MKHAVDLDAEDDTDRPVRLRKVKAGSKCVKRGCRELPAFENAEYCKVHGSEYVEKLKETP